MIAQCAGVAIPSDSSIRDFSVVATRLIEAARFARDGNCEAAKAQIARAIALLRGEASPLPASARRFDRGAGEIIRGGLAAWQKKRLTAYIDAHLTEPIRIEDLAELLTLSKSHFSRAFRTAFGTSAHDYLTRRRVEVAQSLMLTSQEPLCAIALQCGLSDQSHFTRVFRRIVGETPYAWRRTRWGEMEDRTIRRLRNSSDWPHTSMLSSHS